MEETLPDYYLLPVFPSGNIEPYNVPAIKLKSFTHPAFRHRRAAPLKPVSAIFYQIFIFSPNDKTSKTMKSVFYFIEKALFILKTFKFL